MVHSIKQIKLYVKKRQRSEFRKLLETIYKSIETLEKGMKYVQSEQYRHQNDVSDIVLVSLLLTLNIFHTFFSVFFCVDFEQVNVRWVVDVNLLVCA